MALRAIWQFTDWVQARMVNGLKLRTICHYTLESDQSVNFILHENTWFICCIIPNLWISKKVFILIHHQIILFINKCDIS